MNNDTKVTSKPFIIFNAGNIHFVLGQVHQEATMVVDLLLKQSSFTSLQYYLEEYLYQCLILL